MQRQTFTACRVVSYFHTWNKPSRSNVIAVRCFKKRFVYFRADRGYVHWIVPRKQHRYLFTDKFLHPIVVFHIFKKTVIKDWRGSTAAGGDYAFRMLHFIGREQCGVFAR